ncbi:MAG TPA: YggT family protein [Gemmatimonadaceae bacterium]|nr:YggT family protein [Gemmatimonadaceae bacterium]
MNDALAGYYAAVGVVRIALFWIAVAVALVALVDWLVRTRKLEPFGPIPRFFRRFVDPLLAPLERRLVRSGRQPSAAPWWALVVVVVGGILLVTVLNYLGGLFGEVAFGVSSPARFGVMLLSWTLALLRIALIVRVVSTWVQVSPYSPWVRWSYVLTEWMLAPLRRVIPQLGPVDITPIVAYFLLVLLASLVGAR